MPRPTISLEELAKISFLDCSNLGGRVVPLLPCFNDENEWELWLPRYSEIVRIKGGEPVESDYFARRAEKETDIFIEFIDFITKHAYWPDVAFFIDGIRNDIHNLAASLDKINIFYDLSKNRKHVSRFVATETEYIFMVCRSIFDLLQEVVSRLWQRIQLFDTSISKKELPKSFRKMILNNDELMTSEEIQSRHHITKELADFYNQTGPFFKTIRSYRDDIIHSGKGFELIFQTDRGFAIRRDTLPFSTFNVWKEEDMMPNELAPLRPPIAFVIKNTLDSCEAFTAVMKNTIMFPPDVAPGYNLFIRGYHIPALQHIGKILEDEPWWS